MDYDDSKDIENYKKNNIKNNQKSIDIKTVLW